MKKLTFLLFATLNLLMTFSFNLANAQGVGTFQLYAESGFGLTLPMDDSMDDKSEKTIGSPYIYNDFASVKTSATGNKTFKARYNAFTDEIEVKVGEGDVRNFDKSINNVVFTFINDKVEFTTLNFIDSGDGSKRSYVMSLTDSQQSVKLFCKKQKKHTEAKPALTGYDKDKPAEFKDMNDRFFISINDDYARELPKKANDIAALFPTHSKEILNFIKKNKTKTSREADLINLINYINSII